MAKHEKHAKLTLRKNDNFAGNEVTILGTKCGTIASLVDEISTKLAVFKLAYFDASHSENHSKVLVEKFTFHSKGTLESSTNFSVNKFNQRIQFSQYDLVFINGNHYKGENQIVILDKDKDASIKKRLDQLTSVLAFVKLTDDVEIFDCLKEKFSNVDNIPCYTISDIEAISKVISNQLESNKPELNGLVLAGGKSTRMGKDKGTLNFYGKQQRDVALEMLAKNNLPAFLSVRKEQDIEVENKIEDVFLGLGPYGAICSAFQQNPNVAWLVIATDLPFVTDEIIKLLLSKRNPSKAATTIKGKNKEFPEPLITIWEPKSYPLLLAYLSQGYSCPRKVLINSDVEIVEVDDDFIRNINTPEEFEEAKKEINE